MRHLLNQQPFSRRPMAILLASLCWGLTSPAHAISIPEDKVPDSKQGREERQKLQGRIEQLDGARQNLEARLAKAQRESAELREQLTAAQAQAGQSSQKDEEIKRLKTALDSAEKQVASLNSRNRTLESEKQGLDKQLARMQKEAAELKEQLATAQKQAGQGEQKDKELARLKAELAKVEQALSTEKNKPAKVETREVVRPVPDPAQAKELEQLRRDKQSLSTQVAELQRQLRAPAAAVPAAPPARPAVPAAQYIHGWSADKVQALQKQTADALGLPVVGKPCWDCLEEVLIPAGSFDMGSPNTEEGRDGNEGPVHRVTIGQPFALAKTAVTQGQWKAVMGSNSNPSYFKNCGDGCPVEQVSWASAQEFVEKLSEKTGKTYRLPSEAEWEYAARAGTTGPFSFSVSISWEKANYDAKYGYQDSPDRTYRAKTVVAGSQPANPFGLHGMHGNVWEWVEDVYHGSYTDAPQDGSAWLSSGWFSGVDSSRRVVRGGNYGGSPFITRSAKRDGIGSGNRYYSFVGFRLARTLP